MIGKVEAYMTPICRECRCTLWVEWTEEGGRATHGRNDLPGGVHCPNSGKVYLVPTVELAEETA